MAYLPYKTEEEKNKLGVGADVYAKSVAPVSSPGQGGGPALGTPTSSGQFVGLQKFLDASDPSKRVDSVKRAGEGLLGQSQAEFDKAAEPVRGASFATKSVGDIGSQLGSEAGMDDLRNVLSQDYSGPELNYNQSDDLRAGFKNLQSNDTVTDVVNKDAIKAGGYTAGLRNLDTALYGMTPGVAAAQKDFGDQATAWGTQVGDESKALTDKTTGFHSSAKQARDAGKTSLTDYQNNLYGGVHGRTGDLLAKDAASKDLHPRDTNVREFEGDNSFYRPLGQKYRDKTTKNVYTPGTAINDSTAITQDESNKFGALGQLLGTSPVLQKTGEATPGSWRQDVSYSLPSYEVGPNETISAQQPGMSDAQYKKVYEQAQKARIRAKTGR